MPVVVLEQEEKVRAVRKKLPKEKNNGEAQRARNFGEKPGASLRHLGVGSVPRKNLRAQRERELTATDLVVLSLLAERPMHGYQANLELERRQIRDWAPVSRPLVYHSLEKLERRGMLRRVESGEPSAKADPAAFETTDKGREALADTLEREEWTTQREHPAFLIWLALSWQARPGVFRKQLKKRRRFLLDELKREKATLMSIYAEVGHKFHEAMWMVELTINQLRTEIRWNKRLEASLKRRAVATYPFSEGLPK